MLGKSPSGLSVSSCTFWMTPNTTDHRSSHPSKEQPLLDGVILHFGTMNKTRISARITTPASCAAACWSTYVEGQCHRLLRGNWNKNFSPSVYWWRPHWEFFHHLPETRPLLHKIQSFIVSDICLLSSEACWFFTEISFPVTAVLVLQHSNSTLCNSFCWPLVGNRIF